MNGVKVFQSFTNNLSRRNSLLSSKFTLKKQFLISEATTTHQIGFPGSGPGPSRCFCSSNTLCAAKKENVNGNDDLEVKSNRALFKSIPVDPSILSYIRGLGVGISSKKKRKRKQTQTNKSTKGLLSENDEASFFGERESRTGRKDRRKRSTGSSKSSSPENDGQSLHSKNAFIPPPPFSTSSHTKEESEGASEGISIRKLPVKVLGSVGSTEEEMPRSSKGLPEVVSERYI